MKSLPGTLSEYKILIVDDEVSDLKLIDAQLKLMGFNRISLEQDSTKAFHRLLSEDFDLIICDLHMPNMDGIQFYQSITPKDIFKKTPFILISADSTRDSIIEVRKAGINNYLLKSNEPKFLQEKICSMLYSSPNQHS